MTLYRPWHAPVDTGRRESAEATERHDYACLAFLNRIKTGSCPENDSDEQNQAKCDLERTWTRVPVVVGIIVRITIFLPYLSFSI